MTKKTRCKHVTAGSRQGAIEAGGRYWSSSGAWICFGCDPESSPRWKTDCWGEDSPDFDPHPNTIIAIEDGHLQALTARLEGTGLTSVFEYIHEDEHLWQVYRLSEVSDD